MSEKANKMSIIQTFQMKLSKFAAAMGRNLYITAIRDAMLAYVPFTFIASVFLILACLPSETINNLISGVLHVEAAVWQGKLIIVNNATLAIGGLIVILTMANSMAEKLHINRIQNIITCMASYLVLIPLISTEAGDALLLTSVSAQSMFCAMLVGIFGSKLYQLIDKKGFKIKMPASVPPAVSAPFESLIPSFIIVTVFWIVRLIFDAFSTDAVSFINSTIGRPLTLVGGSLLGMIFVVTFQQLLWFFGLHGSSIVAGVMTPILQVLEDQNKGLSMAGESAQNIVSMSFFTHFAFIATVGAVVAALIVARSRQYREVAKIAVGPFIFNVGEPALFGFPIMLNFSLVIPFLLTPAVSTLVAYAGFASGLVPVCTGLVQLPWTTPLFVSGFLLTGSIRGAILQLLCLIASTLVWIPFIKNADRINLQQEAENEKVAEEEA